MATQVNDRVSSLVSDTARLAHYSADTETPATYASPHQLL